ncbi:MAG: ribonuclease Z [Myxococcota bacterium]|nr:ribonuclease Z [Myxococcota bacterium]
MSLRELVVLGTSSQVPTRYRNHNAYLLRWDEEGFLFDPGEGTQRQFILAEVAASAITRICITHFHGDHCLGLAGIVQRLSLDKVAHEVHCYYPGSGQGYFERLRRASIYQGHVSLKAHPLEAPGLVFENRKIELRSAKLQHGVDTYGYRLQERDDCTMLPEKLAELGVKGPAIGQLKRDGWIELDGRTIRLDEVSVEKKGQSMAFVMDTRLCDSCFELAKDVDLLVCEATYLSSEEREAREHGHMTAAQAARLAAECGVRQLVISHFSQRYPSASAFLAEAQAIFPATIAARDLERVVVPRRSKE